MDARSPPGRWSSGWQGSCTRQQHGHQALPHHAPYSGRHYRIATGGGVRHGPEARPDGLVRLSRSPLGPRWRGFPPLFWPGDGDGRRHVSAGRRLLEGHLGLSRPDQHTEKDACRLQTFIPAPHRCLRFRVWDMPPCSYQQLRELWPQRGWHSTAWCRKSGWEDTSQQLTLIPLRGKVAAAWLHRRQAERAKHGKPTR